MADDNGGACSQGTLLDRIGRWLRRHTEAPNTVVAPWAEVLDNIPGGERNLLHKTQLRADLRIEFPQWAFSEPSPFDPDVLELFIDSFDLPVATRSWTASIAADDLFIMLPQRYLTPGEHTVYYRVTLGTSGTSTDSDLFDFTVNTTVPELEGDSGRLVFPAELEQGLTARYLELHGDCVEAEAPEHYPLRCGDVLTWYWELQPVGSLVMGRKVLGLDDLGLPLIITCAGPDIRTQGDGQRYITYDVSSRAGYTSRLSRAVALQVDVAPIPRHWPAATVFDSSGSQVYGVLDPTRALTGVTVRIPAEAIFYEGEVASVQWAVTGSVGATEVTAVITGPGPWSANVGSEYIAAHIGKSLEVVYRLQGNDGYPPSARLTVRVNALAQANLAAVQSKAGAQNSGRISLARVPANGDELSLARWPLIAVRQRLKMYADGTLKSGSASRQWLYNDVAVTSGQASSGVKTVLARTWLALLQPSTPVTLRASVSFDEGQTWTEFPTLPLTIIA